MRHLEWRTPHEWFTGERHSIECLWVLGCGAYVFIPSEVRENKMAPKAELMVFLGMHSGGKGYIFMRVMNPLLFTLLFFLLIKLLILTFLSLATDRQKMFH